MPNCYDCKFRGTSPGSAHSSCQNPAAKEPLAILAGLTGNYKSGKFTVRGNSHGVRMGWFTWPVDFDPVWLEECTGFECRHLDPKPDNTETYMLDHDHNAEDFSCSTCGYGT